MRFRSGMLVAIAAGLVLGGCAPAAAGGGGPQSSPTGKEYPPGTAPTENRYTAPAKLFLAQGDNQQALEPALESVANDPTNPQSYYLAGAVYAGLGDFVAADSMWDKAQEIYPAYELDIEPAREQAWGQAFNEGVTAYNAGNTTAAAEAWQEANVIYPYRGEGYTNLAVLYTQENRYDEAIAAYRSALEAMNSLPQTRTLSPAEQAERQEGVATTRENLAQLLVFTEQFAEAEQLYRQMLEDDPTSLELQGGLASAISRQGREAEAAEIYTRLLNQPGVGYDDLFNIGVSLFNAQDYVRAAEAFSRVAELTPNSRDAWYNYANALYAAEDFPALIPVAEKLVQLDPLNENAALILARAYRDTDQNDKALAALQANQNAPIHVEEMQLRPRDGQTLVSGVAAGNTAEPGTPVKLRFTFYSEGTQLGTQTVTINAPAKDASARFEVSLQNATPANGYRYEIVP